MGLASQLAVQPGQRADSLFERVQREPLVGSVQVAPGQPEADIVDNADTAYNTPRVVDEYYSLVYSATRPLKITRPLTAVQCQESPATLASALGKR